MRLLANHARHVSSLASVQEIGLILLFLVFACSKAWALDANATFGPGFNGVSQKFSIKLPPSSPFNPPKSIAYRGNSFDDHESGCQIPIRAVESEAASSGICGTVSSVRFIPKRLHLGDQEINIEGLCQSHAQCSAANGTKENCDILFRLKLENECREVAAACGDVLGECLDLVDHYADAVEEYGALDEIATKSVGARTLEAARPEPNAWVEPEEPTVTDGEWVYVGEYDGSWISRNFDVNDRISSGSSMTALNYVNIRSDHIRPSSKSEDWENATKLGVVAPGESVVVSAVVNLGRAGAPEHIWAKIAR